MHNVAANLNYYSGIWLFSFNQLQTLLVWITNSCPQDNVFILVSFSTDCTLDAQVNSAFQYPDNKVEKN